jgi:hypothetical protein
MTKLATVTTLQPREESVDTPPSEVSEASRDAYWDRMQALRAELAALQGVG